MEKVIDRNNQKLYIMAMKLGINVKDEQYGSELARVLARELRGCEVVLDTDEFDWEIREQLLMSVEEICAEIERRFPGAWGRLERKSDCQVICFCSADGGAGVSSAAKVYASTGGAMIPMLTLGVPGDAVTAILIGALMMKGLTPGPTLFQKNMDIVSMIFILMFLANAMFLFIGLFGAKYVAKVINCPMKILVPIIAMLCVVGTYAIRNAIFDIWVMVIAGCVGYFFSKAKIPTAPLVLGLVLGDIVESGFRRGLILAKGDWTSFFTRPISLFFLICSVLLLFGPTIMQKVFHRKTALKASDN